MPLVSTWSRFLGLEGAPHSAPDVPPENASPGFKVSSGGSFLGSDDETFFFRFLTNEVGSHVEPRICSTMVFIIFYWRRFFGFF